MFLCHEIPLSLIIPGIFRLEVINTNISLQATWALQYFSSISVSRWSNVQFLHGSSFVWSELLIAQNFIYTSVSFNLFLLPAFLFLLSLRYFSGAVQDLLNGPGGLTCPGRVCSAVQMDMALRVTVDIIPEYTVRESVPSIDGLIVASRFTFDQSSMRSFRLFPIVGEILEQESRYHPPSARYRMTEIDLFTVNPIVWNHQILSPKPGSSIAIYNSDGLGSSTYFYTFFSSTVCPAGFC